MRRRADLWLPKNFSIKQRLAALTAIALLPGAVVLVFLVATFHQDREKEVRDQALRYGQMASLEMARIVSGAEGTLKALARAPVTQSFDPIACSSYFADVNADLPQFTAIAAIDASGLLRCRTEMPQGAVRVNDRAYFQQAMTTGKFVVGEYTKSAVTDVPVLPLAHPIKDKGGAIVGVLVAGLDLDWLGDRLRDRSFLRDSALTIADRNGVIIAREPFPERFVGTRIPDQYHPLVRSEAPGVIEVMSQDGTPRVIGYFPAGYTSTGLYISAGLSTDVALQPVYASTYRSLGIAIAGALAAFAIAWFAGDRLFQRPVNRLLRTIAAWRRGDNTARSGAEPDGDEVAALGMAIDEYMDEVVADRAARRRAEEHRNLVVGELDHRVKNILATVQSVAIQTFKEDMDRESLGAFLARLSAMAAIHETLMSDEWVSGDLRKTIETALMPFDGEEQSRFSLTGPKLMIRAKAALAISMAIHELCTNAVKYGALREAEGRVNVRWSLQSEPSEGGVFEFSWVEQDGPLVSPPDKTGFGSKMIERALVHELAAKVELLFPRSGVVCTIRCSAASLLVDDEIAKAAQQAA
ncbi:MAG: hypothetical protein H0T56_13745 [Pseudaminobacter sp.]|nr:hypothetical protein [Pseudaminobacter sp.]